MTDAIRTERETCSNCAYWRKEMDKAIAKRDLREKEAFESLDGGGRYWRNIAKQTHTKLTRADFILKRRPLSEDERKVAEDNRRWLEIVAHAERRELHVESAKTALWKVWSALDERDSTREAIRKVWETI